MKRMLITAGLACAITAPGLAFAQTAPPQGTKTKPTVTTPAGKAGALAAADKRFFMEAAAGGMAEVELGRLAADKASNADVRQFGQRMVDDHGKANDELKTLAFQKNVTLPADLGAKHKATRDRLAKLSGEAFDKAYMRDMVADHDKDVAAFQRVSKTAKDDDLKAFAAKTLPTLQEHQKMAKEINAKVGGAPAAKGAAKPEDPEALSSRMGG